MRLPLNARRNTYLWPVLFKIGPFEIGSREIGPLVVHSWGVFLMLGFLLAGWRAARNARRYNISGEHMWDVALWALLGGVIGARIAYVLITPNEFRSPLSALYIWKGGMTFYGGLIGGILAGALVCRLRRINVLDVADLAALSLPIGYALGRIGCFFNGCCYGGACDLPWATQFHDADTGALTAPSHPAQLYSALAGIAMYGLLVYLEPRRGFRGQLMLAFLFLYGVYRFCIEFVREGVTADTTPLLGLTEGQIASLILALAAAVTWGVAARRARRSGSGPVTPTATPSTAH